MSIFTDLYVKKPKRSKQVLDHAYISTTDFGKIIPVLLEDLVPGDIFKCKSALQLKLLPTLAPLMTGIEVRIDYFFVPNRLIWDEWEDFITGGDTGTSVPEAPYFSIYDIESDVMPGSLFDYFGLPVYLAAGKRGNTNILAPSTSIDFSALPIRAYDLIYNEYYRDENLQEEVYFSKSSGVDNETSFNLLNRNLKKDYFTSALPWAQRGPAVTIPVGQSAPVKGDIEVISDPSGFTGWNGNYLGVTDPISNGDAKFVNGSLVSASAQSTYEQSSHQHAVDDIVINNTVNQDQYADLSEATGITINEFRRLNAVQRWLERNARAGSRYVEQILSHFGVRTPDYRLQRPEYLGGEKQIIGMAEVLQTSETANSPQGSRAGVGFGNMLAKTRKYYAQEHGLVLGLMSIIPSSNLYSDGFQRKWSRFSKFDYFFPEFQFLGEQEIKQKEIFGYSGLTNPESTFGYTPRYAEYRYHPSEITGNMRTSQAFWHLGRLFNVEPHLNDVFINSGSILNKSQYNRIFPTEENLGDRFSIIIQHFERLKRPMAKNPNPSL